MNTPPKEHINVDHQKLHAFVSTAAQTVGLTAEKAELLAELLTKNALRGVFSHGTQQLATYAILMRDGQLTRIRRSRWSGRRQSVRWSMAMAA